MKIAEVKHKSFGEGPRSNTTIWASGCSIRCPFCFNPDLWAANGSETSTQELMEIVAEGVRQGDTGLALVGGEPLDQMESVLELLTQVKARFPGHVTTLYSGMTWDQLAIRPNFWRITTHLNYLVDGPFVAELKDDMLGYRGSSNQREINVQYTLQYQRIMLENWDNLIVVAKDTIVFPPYLSIFDQETHETISEICGKSKSR